MPNAEKVVLIGAGIAHSRSPRLHNHLFALYGLPLHYSLMPLEQHEVAPAVAAMKRGGFRGANITSPHKLAAMPGMDELSAAATAIGAVNTIVFSGGRAYGHNTDTVGFAASLAHQPVATREFTAAVLGTGGAASAAIHALLAMPGLRGLTVYSRDAARAAACAARWGDRRVAGRGLGEYSAADLVVNATPIGMATRPGMPIPAERLGGTALLYEMIYSPAETALMRAARAAGVPVAGGAEMFVGQALASFQLWTGIAATAADVPADLFTSEQEMPG